MCLFRTTLFTFWCNSLHWARASSFMRFLDHTQRRTTFGRTPLDEWSARRRDLYLTTHDTHNRQMSMPRVGFKPTISADERPQTYDLDRAATRISRMTVRVTFSTQKASNVTVKTMLLPVHICSYIKSVLRHKMLILVAYHRDGLVPVAARSKAYVCGSSPAEIVGSNPSGRHGCLSVVSVVCCQVEVSATSCSLVQRSPTDCGTSLYVIQKPREWGGPGPLGGGAVAPKTKNNYPGTL